MMQELIIKVNEKRKIVLVHDTSESAERVIRLAGEGAEVFVDEIFLGNNVASNLIIVHDAVRTVSRVNSRGVVDKNKTVFAHAKIIIPKHAQLSDSFVAQRFMLLDKTSKAEAIPSLEIEANEVKASHSAIVAPLDQEKVFYMMSKGLSYADACELLVEGFLQIPEEYQHLWQKAK